MTQNPSRDPANDISIKQDDGPSVSNHISRPAVSNGSIMKPQYRKKSIGKQITRFRLSYSCHTCRRRKVRCDKVCRPLCRLIKYSILMGLRRTLYVAIAKRRVLSVTMILHHSQIRPDCDAKLEIAPTTK